MLKRIAGPLSALVLVAFTIVTSFSIEGSVLCLGEDGHVAIEFFNACGSAEFGAQLARVEDDSCGTCKDVRMFSSPAHTRSVSHSPQLHFLTHSTLVSRSLPPQQVSPKHENLPEYSARTSLTSLRSVVLLI